MWSLKCKVFMMLMIARQVLALLVEKGTCPENITALSDFDMDRFRGRWYTYSSLLNLKNNTPECAYVEFIKRANGSYFAKASEINQRTNTIKLSYHGIGRIEPKLGTYEITSRSSSSVNLMCDLLRFFGFKVSNFRVGYDTNSSSHTQGGNDTYCTEAGPVI
ncbi:CG31659 [Drosophila busckii]|uniref:CG31659 n=1 Tax=Drosophila busckii TaxID=30019 RepID=A0A0M4E617_DROBS|nr:CG31659 [Drosophila busckii]